MPTALEGALIHRILCLQAVKRLLYALTNHLLLRMGLNDAGPLFAPLNRLFKSLCFSLFAVVFTVYCAHLSEGVQLFLLKLSLGSFLLFHFFLFLNCDACHILIVKEMCY